MNSDDAMYTFAERLKGFRKREGLTQDELAAKLGNTRRTISDWERGLYLPKYREAVLDLAETLGLSVADTNLLLAAAQKPLEPVPAGVEGGAARFEEAHVGVLVVERLEAGPPVPSGPIPTRVPESKARKLVGREDEIAWVCQQLRSGEMAAVVGVRGIGGIGKTEVAIAAVEALRSHFGNEVIWLEGGANDVFAIQGRLAEALGVRLEARELATRADALHLALRSGPPRLIVLDDLRRCHLADFIHLKPPCPPCALLVTSRRADLPLPDEAILRLDQLEPVEARALLESLLPAGWLGREPGLADEVAEFLERIPLALTLAARRARQIGQRRDGGGAAPLATLLAELRARRLQVLNQGEDPRRPDLSVVITFDASYGDLEPADQARLRRLGVFARNEFELAAMQAVWGDDEGAARQAVQRLASAGLVEEAADDAWWMHDLLREYAAERLARAGAEEVAAAQLAHAEHWRRILDKRTRRSVADWKWLGLQRPEVEQAANWLMSNWHQALEQTAALMIAISRVYRSYTWPQWELWMQTGKSAAKSMQAVSTMDDPRKKGRWGENVMNLSLADLHRIRGRYDEAERLYRENLQVVEDLGDRHALAITQSSLAESLFFRGQYDEAEHLLRETLGVFRESSDYLDLGIALTRLADLLRAQGRYDEAIELHRDALRFKELVGDRHSVAVTESRLAELLHIHGQYDEAEQLLRESLKLFDEVADLRSAAVTQSTLAELLRIRGRPDAAEHFLRDSLRKHEAVGDGREAALTKSSLGLLLRDLGKYDEAEHLYSESLRAHELAGNRREIAVTKSGLAGLLQSRGHFDAAERLYRESLQVFVDVGDRREAAVTQNNLAGLLMLRGHNDEAERLYSKSLRVFEDLSDHHTAGLTKRGLAGLLVSRGHFDKAERLYRESLQVCENVGDRHSVALTQSSLAALLATRRQYVEAERLYRESLQVLEDVGNQHGVALTKSGLAGLLRTRGQYDEAERLYRSGLATLQKIRDPQGVGVCLVGLGRLALDRGQPDEAVPLLHEARQCFDDLGLPHLAASVDDLLTQAEGNTLTLDDLVSIVRAARGGDRQAGQRAWEICGELLQAPDPTTADIGRGLQRTLAGVAPEVALAGLPDELRAQILEGLSSDG